MRGESLDELTDLAVQLQDASAGGQFAWCEEGQLVEKVAGDLGMVGFRRHGVVSSSPLVDNGNRDMGKSCGEKGWFGLQTNM